MTAHHITFVEYNVQHDLEKRKEMVAKSGQMGVPVIDIDGTLMVGYDEAKLASALGVIA